MNPDLLSTLLVLLLSQHPSGRSIPVCAQDSTAAHFRSGWSLEKVKELKALLDHHDRDAIVARWGCVTAGKTRIDLRGLVTDSLYVPAGSYALAGVDLSYASIGVLRARNAYLTGCRFDAADLGTLEFVRSDLSNCSFSNLSLRAPKRLRIEGGQAHSSTWLRVWAPSAEIRNLTAQGAELNSVDFTGAEIVGSAFGEVSAFEVRLDGATLSNSRFHFSRASRVSLRDASVDHLDLSESVLIEPDLTGMRGNDFLLDGSRLFQPRLGSRVLELVDWRFVVWLEFTLGNEKALEERHRQGADESMFRYEHGALLHHYVYLENLFQESGLREYARGFQVARSQFEARHTRIPKRWFIVFTQGWVDAYGTSLTRWMNMFLWSVAMVWAMFLIYHYAFGGQRLDRAWVTWDSGSLGGRLRKGVPREEESASNPTPPFFRVASYTLLLSVGSLLIFVDRLLDIEGILSRFGIQRPEFNGAPRVVSGLAALWGLYLGIRGMAVLAQVV